MASKNRSVRNAAARVWSSSSQYSRLLRQARARLRPFPLAAAEAVETRAAPAPARSMIEDHLAQGLLPLTACLILQERTSQYEPKPNVK